MKDLYQLLQLFQQNDQPKSGKLCIVNTDNVPNNASLIQTYMTEIAQNDNSAFMQQYISTKLAFLNSMVDRITSQREGSNGMVPLCEPIPAKALVLLDPQQDLPSGMKAQPGVVVRNAAEQLETDIALKLRVANGTHTAIAHALALLHHFQTDVLSNTNAGGPLFMKYLDSLTTQQIIPAAVVSKSMSASEDDANAAWQDWRQRLLHPAFGLSTFFITQNGTAKGGIRWGPTVTDLIFSQNSTTAAMAFAYAALLRWLTPLPGTSQNVNGVFKGWLEGFKPSHVAKNLNKDTSDGAVEYADGLHHCANDGWYEYKCPLVVQDVGDSKAVPFPIMLEGCIGQRPNKCVVAIRAYLLASAGGDLDATTIAAHPEFENMVHAIASFYSRMVTAEIENEGTKPMLSLLQDLGANSVGGLVGFDTPCGAMVDHYMYLSGI
jgi:hypothetical protein